MIYSLRAKERQQQKQQMTTSIEDLMLPTIPISRSSSLIVEVGQDPHTTSSIIQTSENNMYHSINIKDEKVESPNNVSSPVLKARKEFSTTFMAKPIDRRREEVNERSILFNKKTVAPISRSSRSMPRKPSSSATDVELVLDSGRHSQILTHVLPTMDNEEDMVESKSFIHNHGFNINTPIETNK